MNGLKASVEGRGKRLGLEAVDAASLVRHVKVPRDDIPVPVAQVRQALRIGETLLANLERFLDPFAFGNVLYGEDHPRPGFSMLVRYHYMAAGEYFGSVQGGFGGLGHETGRALGNSYDLIATQLQLSGGHSCFVGRLQNFLLARRTIDGERGGVDVDHFAQTVYLDELIGATLEIAPPILHSPTREPVDHCLDPRPILDPVRDRRIFEDFAIQLFASRR